jgi:hypothetical protein
MGRVWFPNPYNSRCLLPSPHLSDNCSTIEDKDKRLFARRLELTVNPLPLTGGDLPYTQFIVKLKDLCQ